MNKNIDKKLNKKLHMKKRHIRRLFICERPYPLYRTLVKCVNDQTYENDIIISNHVEGMERMYEVLKNEKIFQNVYYFNDTLYKRFYACGSDREYKKFPQNILILLKKLYLYMDMQYKAAEIILPDGLDMDLYDQIYVNDASSTLMLHLCSKKKTMIWVEHAKDVFQARLTAVYWICFHIMQLLEKLGILYSLHGTSRWVEAVEVSHNERLIPLIRKKKIIEVNLDKIIERMTDEQKECIFELYCKAYGLKFAKGRPLYIVLTSPLFEDGVVQSEEEKVRVIRNIIKRKVRTNDNVLVKPHPRDQTDYSRYIPNIQVVDKSISAEVLNFATEYVIEAVYGVITSSLAAFTNAVHREYITKEQIMQFL